MKSQLALWSFQQTGRLNFSNFSTAMGLHLDFSLCL